MEVKRQEIIDVICRLRWGLNPKPDQLRAVFTYKAIGEIVKRSVQFCRTAALEFRKSLQDETNAHRTKTRKGLRLMREKMEKKTDLTEEHINFITSPETLKRQIGMSLEERTAEFLR